jgi:hypothetical protein
MSGSRALPPAPVDPVEALVRIRDEIAAVASSVEPFEQ